MSNWLMGKCDTLSNVELTYLEDALARMNMYADFDTQVVTRAYDKDSRPCHALLRYLDNKKSLNVGLVFEVHADADGEERVTLQTIGDWYDSSLTEKSFMERFTIEYTTVKAIALARKEGYAVREEVAQEDGRRRLVLARVA